MTRGAVAVTAAVGVALVVIGLIRFGAEPPISPTAVEPTPTRSTLDSSRVATQPVWDPFDVEDAPRSTIAFTTLLGSAGRLQPDIGPGANTLREDPMTAVVVAWAEKRAGVQLLGTDGRWRSAPESMESNRGTEYQPDAPVISSDGTKVAAATEEGLRVLDVRTGDVATVGWPEAIEVPWDWAPGIRWLPGDASLLVLHWKGPWIVTLDGDAARAPYDTEEGVSDVFGISPDGLVFQNDYPRNTVITWDDDEAVREAPFPQCERLTASDDLVACTTGSLRSMESGPVVVDSATGEIVAYAPVRDPNAIYSDNGRLTTMGFLDPDTVLLMVGPEDFKTPQTETWHLVAWLFREGRFERIATGSEGMWSISVAPSLMD